MPKYQRGHRVRPNVVEIHLRFERLISLAETVDADRKRRGLPPAAAGTRAQLLVAYATFNDRLRLLAVETAGQARQEALDQLKRKQKRPDTGQGPHLRGAVRCRPLYRFGKLETGEVGIGDIERLDKVVNPLSPEFGPYWRAIEYGTRRHVGRIIYGYYFGTGLSGQPDRPRSEFAGSPSPPHPIFVTARAARALYGGVGFSGGAGVRGGAGGLGTIRNPIVAQGFLEAGYDRTKAPWLAGLRAVERAVDRELTPILTRTAPRPAGARLPRGRRR